MLVAVGRLLLATGWNRPGRSGGARGL